MITRKISVTTGSRLHFGLLSLKTTGERLFGGLGLMVDRPGLNLLATPSVRWEATGPLHERLVQVAENVARELVHRGLECRPLAFRVERSAQEHVGLGTGTQLSLATSLCVLEAAGVPRPSAMELAGWASRGRRSGIGLHGFDRGGLIVDGGHRPGASEKSAPPLLFRASFPTNWAVLMIIPRSATGLSGTAELRAFQTLPDFPDALVDRLCRLVLLGIMPAIAEADLRAFGETLERIQTGVGSGFAPAQGGTFADSGLDELAHWLRSQGVMGVGQSSWGPTLYGFIEADPTRQDFLRRRLLDRFSLNHDEVFWTIARNRGADLRVCDA